MGILDTIPRHMGFRCEGIAADPDDVVSDTVYRMDILDPLGWTILAFAFVLRSLSTSKSVQQTFVGSYCNAASLMR